MLKILPTPEVGLLALLAILTSSAGLSQTLDPPGATTLTIEDLDPTRNLPAARLESAIHQPLSEQYIWTREDAVPDHPSFDGRWLSGQDQELGKHYFRRSFDVGTLPAAATLYIAGPRTARIYLNGQLVGSYEANLDLPLGIRVFACDASRALREGRNVLAIEGVRGPDIGSGADSRLSFQQTRGKVLAAKIVPAAPGVNAEPLVISDSRWKASMQAAEGWQEATFDDRAWQPVDSLGGMESSIEFFQWNADAGLYDWPGYDGISPFLAQYELAPASVTHVYNGLGKLSNVDALTKPGIAGPFLKVELPAGTLSSDSAPQIVLDFGREVDGRLEVTSDSDTPSDITIQYGESRAELLNKPYLGVTPLHVAARTTAYGPKSAFRFALVRFISGRDTSYKSIQLNGINYPVTYKGYFESSDEKLNKMWAIGAYTAHLCMQDDIWDAPKRDRGRWMGDLDVSGRTIEDAFDDRFLMEQTLDRLLGDPRQKKHVNGIAGYSAFWITGETKYYKHVGSRQQLESIHDRLVKLMHFMETELDDRNLYVNHTKSWPFVDWSPELNGDTSEARRATEFEFYAAFRDGVYLLTELHDRANADLFQHRADDLKAAAQKYLLEPSGSFGSRWQTNAYAVLSGTANPSQYEAIWHNSLSTVGHINYNGLIVTPYYNYYVISAMARIGHRADALAWIRQYWGGMLEEGATSFWEGYDPSWYKDDWHASLQADNMSGYRVSLAHGWSSGVTPWLMEEVLGIKSQAAGFSKVDIRPDLLDLTFARGAEPTPRGPLKVDIGKSNGFETAVDLPAGTEARVFVPVSRADQPITVNGKRQSSTPAENGTRAIVTLAGEGHYILRAE